MESQAHDLVHELPEYRDLIHQLKVSDAHFRTLFDRYHEVNKAIHRAEQRVELMSEIDEEKMRKERLSLKDQLVDILKRSSQN